MTSAPWAVVEVAPQRSFSTGFLVMMLNPLDLTVQDYAKLLQRVTLSAKVCHLCKSASLMYWYLEIWQQGCCSPDMEKWFILVSSLAESNWAERKFQLNFLLFCCNYFSQETLLCNLDLSAIFIFLQKYLLVYLYFVTLFFPFLPKNSVIFSENIWSQNSQYQ